MAKNSFKNKYKKKFKKSFKSFNPMFSSNQFLRLKASLDTHLGKRINECLDKDFDTFSLDEQVQMNKELGAKFDAK
tara:strand:+ start:191 stop:418 length:228 start_codon:yes stop_codon:yes gene_type:complete